MIGVLTMSNCNLDRFSHPLDSERVGGYWMDQMIEEQTELNKKDLIDRYISTFYNDYNLVPDAETIQEIFYMLELDDDMINERRRLF
jgi:hypothetical protein